MYNSFDAKYKINSVKAYISKSSRRIDIYYYLIFLCGKQKDGYGNTNREIVGKYLSEKSDIIKIVLSEELNKSSNKDNFDLLTFEELLLDLSDELILFVESYGTVAELGAFSMSELGNNYSKLIIINDNKYLNEKSFISEGPIKKLRELGSIVEYGNINDGALLSERNILNVLNALVSNSKKVRTKKVNSTEKISINPFIFEILELLELYQPIDKNTLLNIYKKSKGFKSIDFVKNDGKEYSKTKNVSFAMIIDFMKSINFIDVDEEDRLFINKDIKVSQLMFTYSKRTKNKLRNKILLERIKGGETPWLIH